MALNRIKEDNLSLLFALIVGLFGFLLYANTITNDYALDDELVTRNHPLTSKGITAIPEILTSYYYNNQVGNYYEYRPMVHISFAIEHSLFGESPHISHSINAVLYGLSCILLLFMLRYMAQSNGWLFPLLATLLFAAHPLHTEVVASIKNRDEILSFLFGIAALYSALKYCRTSNRLPWLLFVVFMVLAVASKRTALIAVILTPLASVMLASPSLKQIVALAIPLSLLSMLFSPNKQNYFLAFITTATLFTPVIVWVVQQLLEKRNPLKIVQREFSVGGTTSYGKSSSAALTNIKYILGYFMANGFFLLSSYLLVYLDLMFLFIILAVLWFIWASSLDKERNLLALQPLILALAMFCILYNQFQYVSFLTLLLVFPVLFFNDWVSRIITLLPVLLLFGFGIVFSEASYYKDYARLAMLIALVLVWLFKAVKSKKYIYITTAVLCLVVLFYATKPQWFDIGSKFALLFTVIFAFAPIVEITKRRVWLALGGLICTIGLFYYASSYNAYYQGNLGEYYQSLPDPYGEGVQNPMNIVPSAGRDIDPVENPLVNVESTSVKLATAIKVMGFYAYKMVVPVNLGYYYGFNQISLGSFSQLYVWLSLLLLVAILTLAYLSYSKHRLLSFGLLYVLVSLFFISNLGVLLTGIVGERLAYSATLGFCLVVAYALMLLFKQPLHEHLPLKGLSKGFIAVAAILIIAFSSRTVIRNTDWKDRMTLYTHDIKYLNKSAKAHQLLGFEYISLALNNPSKSDYYLALAEQRLKESLNIAPWFHTAMYNLGYLYSLREDCKNAVIYYERFIAVSTPPPDLLFHYASCLDVMERINEASAQYLKVIAMDPYFLPAYTNLSYIYFRQGNLQQAAAFNIKALEYMPNESDPMINLGKVYLQMNEPQKALEYFEKAFTLKPNDLNLVLTLYDLHSQIGDPSRGQFFYNKALQLGYTPN